MNQTYSNKEIIVVDDGSTDGSLKVALEFESAVVKVYALQNRGACAARNYGFEKSKGKYIQYLDADDLLSPDKVEWQVNLLESLPSGFVANCPWETFRLNPKDRLSQINPLYNDLPPIDFLVTAWNTGSMLVTHCWLTPRSIIEIAGPWDVSLKKNQDGEFFCRVVLASRGIKFCPSTSVLYRSHQGARISRRNDFAAASSCLKSFKSFEKNILKFTDSQTVRNTLAKNYASFIYEYFDVYPGLIEEAKTRIRLLGITEVSPVGGKKFVTVARFVGFFNLLLVRKYLRICKKTLIGNASENN